MCSQNPLAKVGHTQKRIGFMYGGLPVNSSNDVRLVLGWVTVGIFKFSGAATLDWKFKKVLFVYFKVKLCSVQNTWGWSCGTGVE